MATNPYTPLDEDRKKLVLAEAQNRANRLGISKEQALYNYAVENGIDPAGVDTYMGFSPGTTQNWAVQNGQLAAPQGNYNPGSGAGVYCYRGGAWTFLG